jgi:hypothetical protein
MPRFRCTHNPTALEKFTLPDGRMLAFGYRGILDTDEEGARVIRAHPLFGRLILEEDESAPTHRAVPALETPPAVVGGTDGRRRSSVPPEVLAAREAWAHRKAAVIEHAKAVRTQIEAAEASRHREPTPDERWLLDELRCGGGEVEAAPTIARARAAGITAKRLRTARECLARTVKRGWKSGWRWVLLDKEAFLANGTGASSLDSVAEPEFLQVPPMRASSASYPRKAEGDYGDYTFEG